MSLDLQIKKLDDLMASMPALPAQAKQRSQRRQIITSLYPRIQEFLNKNYSHERVCELISSATGIEFKVVTLKKYLYEERLRRGAGRSPRGRRNRSGPGKARSNAALPSRSSPNQDENPELKLAKAETPPVMTASATQPKTSHSETSASSPVQAQGTKDDLLPEPEFNRILRS